jgi:hypothetical protein
VRSSDIIVQHRTHFKFRAGEHEIGDVFTIVRHLPDFLIRCVLSEIGYEGKYQPVFWRWRGDAPLDWVKDDTKSERLGFVGPMENVKS